MVKLLGITLFCVTCGVYSAFGQGKVLIVTGDSSGFVTRFQNKELGIAGMQDALAQHYRGTVETRIGILPDTLTTYDAIFTDLSFLENGDSSFVAFELEKLTNYLAGGGKLYIQVSLYTIFYRSFDFENPAYAEYPLFREYVGVTQIGTAAAEIHGIYNIQGVFGYFTDGLRYTRKTDPTETNSGAVLFLDGDLTPVLIADGYATREHLGLQYEKQNAKVIWHWPIVTEHYDEFVGRVVCNYFELCEPLKHVAIGEQTEDFAVRFDPLTNNINMTRLRGYSRVELYSTLGVKLLEGTIDSEDAAFSASLPSGHYMVVVRGEGAVVARPVIVWR